MISDVSLRICIRYHRRRGCRGLSARRKVGSAAVHPPAPGSASSGAAKRISHAPPPPHPPPLVLRAWAPPVAARYRHRSGAEPRRPPGVSGALGRTRSESAKSPLARKAVLQSVLSSAKQGRGWKPGTSFGPTIVIRRSTLHRAPSQPSPKPHSIIKGHQIGQA